MNILNSLKQWARPTEQKSNRDFEILDTDVFLVSYPKSGNTWVRFLLGNYITDGHVDFSVAHLVMPEVHSNPDQISKIEHRPRFIKSHFPYRPEYKKVIYLVRDGRDMAVSYYYFLLKMNRLPRETTFSNYLENFFFAGKSEFGHWNTHVFSWMRDNRLPHLLVVKYEDILANREQKLAEMVRFSNLEIDEERLKKAVMLSSFEAMQKDENKNAEKLKERGHTIEGPNLRIVRSGKSSSWKTMFSDKQAEKFIELYGDALEFLNYMK